MFLSELIIIDVSRIQKNIIDICIFVNFDNFRLLYINTIVANNNPLYIHIYVLVFALFFIKTVNISSK